MGAEDLTRLPDEVHYVRVPNTSWEISLWRYLPYSEAEYVEDSIDDTFDEVADERRANSTASASTQRKKVWA